MTAIVGFQPKSKGKPKRRESGEAIPAALYDPAAQRRLLDRIRTMGEAFFEMSESDYGEWLDGLPQDEFFELISLS